VLADRSAGTDDQAAESLAAPVRDWADSVVDSLVDSASVAAGYSADPAGSVGPGSAGPGSVGLGSVGLGSVGLGSVGLGSVGLGSVGLGSAGLGSADPGSDCPGVPAAAGHSGDHDPAGSSAEDSAGSPVAGSWAARAFRSAAAVADGPDAHSDSLPADWYSPDFPGAVRFRADIPAQALRG